MLPRTSACPLRRPSYIDALGDGPDHLFSHNYHPSGVKTRGGMDDDESPQVDETFSDDLSPRGVNLVLGS